MSALLKEIERERINFRALAEEFWVRPEENFRFNALGLKGIIDLRDTQAMHILLGETTRAKAYEAKIKALRST